MAYGQNSVFRCAATPRLREGKLFAGSQVRFLRVVQGESDVARLINLIEQNLS